MDQSLIAWMVNGGERFESREDQRRRAHRLAVHESTERAVTRPAFFGLFGRWTGRSVPTSGLAADCCAA